MIENRNDGRPVSIECPVEAEIIYRDQGKTKADYLYHGPSVKDGIAFVTDIAWEDTTHRLKQSLYILRHPNGEILATGIYQPGTSRKYHGRPDLLWIRCDGQTERRPCHYGKGGR